ncbi:hypothetical protein [Lepagella muris]|nr:hypothetical protein [Lepagella muris]
MSDGNAEAHANVYDGYGRASDETLYHTSGYYISRTSTVAQSLT